MRIVDLHTHSTASDGSVRPSQLVKMAHDKGLAALALTDHDTVAGLDEAAEAAKAYDDLEFIPGIEFSSEYEGRDIHIVGLYMDYRNESVAARLDEFVDSRVRRNIRMCELLRENGLDISFDRLQEAFPESVITRAHYARYMLEHKMVGSLQEAFDRYIGDRCKCFVPREKISPAMAVKMVLEAGGVPILAHPVLYHMSDARLRRLVGELKEEGLMGIEVIYSTYTPSEERDMKRIASDFGLLRSGGSDFHGANKEGIDLGSGKGRLSVPEEYYLAIREAADNKALAK
ncbi:PHP domain-containing protein [Butyrivibrio sp. MC2013]|uniref:PHP domain-containing protein n=1 Tax=Butyrivibrio sp. MC2013 TaxID=1280686 RepID=UPI000403AC3C|nr:PHP domain-containing protein [Butyrivibrio sp. MC2013]